MYTYIAYKVTSIHIIVIKNVMQYSEFASVAVWTVDGILAHTNINIPYTKSITSNKSISGDWRLRPSAHTPTHRHKTHTLCSHKYNTKTIKSHAIEQGNL